MTRLAQAARGVLRRLRRQPLRLAAFLSRDRAAARCSTTPSGSSRSAAWPRCSAASACCCRARGAVAGVVTDRAAGGGVPGEPVHGARARALQAVPRWALYARLPLQPLMMWWAWRATRRLTIRARAAALDAATFGSGGHGVQTVMSTATAVKIATGEPESPDSRRNAPRPGSAPGAACCERTPASPSASTRRSTRPTACR